MKSASQGADRRVAKQIHRYLMKHQQAEDTLDGIIHWWLLEEKLVAARTTVQAAVNHLVRQGLVLKRQGEDGTIYFRLNPRPDSDK